SFPRRAFAFGQRHQALAIAVERQDRGDRGTIGGWIELHALVSFSQMKTALGLSGGGMFGASQAGAWKALSRRCSPGSVFGASVGALNGWYIASGASAEELERQWLDPAAGDILMYRPRRSRWRGLVDPRPLEARVKQMMSERQPRVPFGVVLTQLPRMRPKLF